MINTGFGLLDWQELQSLWWLRAEHQLDGVSPALFLSPKSQRHAVNNRAASLAEMVNVQNNSAIRTYIDKDGVLQTAPANVMRITYERGYPQGLLEGAATNFAENSGNTGAVIGVIGAGGSFPAYTSLGAVTGITSQIVATGETDGVPWTEIRISGTNTSGAAGYPDMSPVNRPVAAVGETWTYSAYAALVAGAWPNSSGSGRLNVSEYSAANTYLSASQAIEKVSNWRRYSTSRTFSNASAAKARGFISLQINAGETVDFTFRIGGLQLEKSPAPTSLIQTTGTVLTRTADLATLHSSAGDMTAWAFRGYIPTLIVEQRLLSGEGGAYIRSGITVTTDLIFDGIGTPTISWAAGLPGSIGLACGFGAGGRRAALNGGAAKESATPPDRSRTTMFIGRNTGLVAGQVIYLDELVAWVLPDRPSAAGVQSQARAAA